MGFSNSAPRHNLSRGNEGDEVSDEADWLFNVI